MRLLIKIMDIMMIVSVVMMGVLSIVGVILTLRSVIALFK